MTFFFFCASLSRKEAEDQDLERAANLLLKKQPRKLLLSNSKKTLIKGKTWAGSKMENCKNELYYN